MARRLQFVLVVFLAGCAARQPVAVVPPPPAVDDIAAAIAHGCHRCLEQAYDVAQARGVRQLAFEAAALLVLRSKEVGTPYEPWLERARALAASDGSGAVVLAIIEAAPVDPLTNREASLNVPGRFQARASLPAWRQQLQTAQGSVPFRAYLDVSLICAYQGAPERETALTEAQWPQASLVQYRVGICASSYGKGLATMRAADPAYVDADFFLGRYALEDAANADQDDA